MPDGAGEAFTLLTTEPGPDVAPIHNRQMVVLDRPDWLAWLDLSRPESELLRPLPARSLAVEIPAICGHQLLGVSGSSPIKWQGLYIAAGVVRLPIGGH